MFSISIPRPVLNPGLTILIAAFFILRWPAAVRAYSRRKTEQLISYPFGIIGHSHAPILKA